MNCTHLNTIIMSMRVANVCNTKHISVFTCEQKKEERINVPMSIDRSQTKRDNLQYKKRWISMTLKSFSRCDFVERLRMAVTNFRVHTHTHKHTHLCSPFIFQRIGVWLRKKKKKWRNDILAFNCIDFIELKRVYKFHFDIFDCYNLNLNVNWMKKKRKMPTSNYRKSYILNDNGHVNAKKRNRNLPPPPEYEKWTHFDEPIS